MLQGAVGLRVRVYNRTMCFVNCHFAAHLEAVNRRNADFDHVYRTMNFTRPSSLFNAATGIVPYLILSCSLACSMFFVWLVYGSGLPLLLCIAVGSSSAVQALRSTNVCIFNMYLDLEFAVCFVSYYHVHKVPLHVQVLGANSSEGIPELSEADMVIFLGDFNYRLDGISYDEARDFISQRSFDWLRERDQLRAEMEAGNVFQGMREAVIRFPPTYKFDKHQPGLAGTI